MGERDWMIGGGRGGGGSCILTCGMFPVCVDLSLDYWLLAQINEKGKAAL